MPLLIVKKNTLDLKHETILTKDGRFYMNLHGSECVSKEMTVHKILPLSGLW